MTDALTSPPDGAPRQAPPDRPTSGERPAGRVTVGQGTALYVGTVLGTGVIALPALAARAAGPASLLAWLGLVVLSAPLAATFAALGARHPDAGGVSTYVRRALGARAAGVVVRSTSRSRSARHQRHCSAARTWRRRSAAAGAPSSSPGPP